VRGVIASLSSSNAKAEDHDENDDGDYKIPSKEL
jgi:hypothetical protein